MICSVSHDFFFDHRQVLVINLFYRPYRPFGRGAFLQCVPVGHIVLHGGILAGTSLRVPMEHIFLRSLIRIVPPNADVFMILMIVDGSTVVCKAVWFHCAVHISLRCFFCFLQRLKVLLFIKSVLDRMINHHLIPWRHALLIAVYRFFGQPFRFIRESIIQFPHFSNLHEYVSCPQMLLVSLSFTQKIFTIAAQTV